MQLILLAGGKGSRLGWLTSANNKHFLPIHTKPMIFFPLSIGLLAGCDLVVIVTAPEYLESMHRLVASFPVSKIKFNIVEQKEAGGVTEAIACALPHLRNEPAMTILGDNFFYGNSLPTLFSNAFHECVLTGKTQIFTQKRTDYSDFGVVRTNGENLEFIEKPAHYEDQEQIITGGYIFDKNSLFEASNVLSLSNRNEIEITALLQLASSRSGVTINELGQGVVWSDMGTVERMNDTSLFVRSVESLTGKELANVPNIIKNIR